MLFINAVLYWGLILKAIIMCPCAKRYGMTVATTTVHMQQKYTDIQMLNISYCIYSCSIINSHKLNKLWPVVQLVTYTYSKTNNYNYTMVRKG